MISPKPTCLLLLLLLPLALCTNPHKHTQSLEVLDLSYNNLVGELPEAFAAMGSLRELLMDVNRLEGPLPGDNTH